MSIFYEIEFAKYILPYLKSQFTQGLNQIRQIFLWYVPYEGPDWGVFVIYSKGAIMKQKLSIDELITHMKNKGIKFNIVSEQDARKFLT